MAAIQFYCPECNALIAFDEKHAGKAAHCLKCGQHFFIPDKNDQPPQIIDEIPEVTDPVPGFYKAVFVDTFELFTNKENVTTLVFIIAVVTFKFILAPACCFNIISYIIVWGWLFGLYLNIIHDTAFDMDELPHLYLGTSISWLWYVFEPILIFLAATIVSLFPFMIALALMQKTEVTYETLWQGFSPLHLIAQFLFIIGCCIFPMIVLTLSMGREVTLLQPNYILKPIIKKFFPYTTASLLLILTALLEMQTHQLNIEASILANSANLLYNFAVQFSAICACRAIGLFYRHYSCYFAF